MTMHEFRRLLGSFVDPGDSVVTDGSQIAFSVSGVSYFLSVRSKEGEVEVSNPDEEKYVPAVKWIIKNLANLDLLAQRLLDFLLEPPNFISPSIKKDVEGVEEESVGQILDDLNEYIIHSTGSFQTNLLYLISDAGEGKSTVLTKFAIDQAKKYKNKETEWLLLPIELGGRTLMRFDDIIIGVLQNKYRFPYLYYSSFIELVKMGIIVPAFDGFEEMFVETSSREAFSAMSNLVESFDSVGTMIVAARKAFFDFENIKIKESIIDTLCETTVVFDKFEIQKWNKGQFIEFAVLNDIPNPEHLYERVLNALEGNRTHPILTRPVFVRKLFELCLNDAEQEDFVAKIRTANTQFLKTFVESIINREIIEKWVDRSGIDDVQTPLLTIEEHFRLLSLVALTMWESQKESIDLKSLEFVAHYFAELSGKSSFEATKIAARLSSHALIIKQNATFGMSNQCAFEHESFWKFFLGYAVFEQIREFSNDNKLYLNLRNTLRSRILPIGVAHSVVDFFMGDEENVIRETIKALVNFCSLDDKTSYTQDNTCNIIIRLLKNIDYQGNHIKNLNFPINSLRARYLKNVVFEDCYFAPTAIKNSVLVGCSFIRCEFESLNFSIEQDERTIEINNTHFDDCEFHSIQTSSQDSIWDPVDLNEFLSVHGLLSQKDPIDSEIYENPTDDKLACFSRVMRYFQRSTHISDNVILMKTGSYSSLFRDEVLPELLEMNILTKIVNKGSNNQDRYKLGYPFKVINEAIQSSKGSYDLFIREFSSS